VIADGAGVAVNEGLGFRPALNGETVGSGVRIRTEAATATIIYENGCSQKLEPNSIAVVLASAPSCETAGGLKDEVVALPSLSTAAWVTGGLALAGGTALVVTESLHPASP
jgi:hypothetical protein